jgi:enoyl ACP reductase
MLLGKKKLLITGVLTDQSIAFAAARIAQEEGAQVLLTGFGRGMAVTKRSARRLPENVDVLDMDVNDPAQIKAVAGEIKSRWGSFDGFLHAIAFAPGDALGGNFLDTPYESAAVAFQTSAYSLKAMAAEFLPVMNEGSSIVSLDFDATVAWPIYDWMGVSKAALEAVTRYLARDLGPRNVRVNAVSAGPLRTMAAKAIPGFDVLAAAWSSKAPLGWDVQNADPVGRTIAFLLSDWSAGITGEIIHVDGGYHAMGAPIPSSED